LEIRAWGLVVPSKVFQEEEVNGTQLYNLVFVQLRLLMSIAQAKHAPSVSLKL
jgi:hypothetical protein